jgi:hypothetical protein
VGRIYLKRSMIPSSNSAVEIISDREKHKGLQGTIANGCRMPSMGLRTIESRFI